MFSEENNDLHEEIASRVIPYVHQKTGDLARDAVDSDGISCILYGLFAKDLDSVEEGFAIIEDNGYTSSPVPPSKFFTQACCGRLCLGALSAALDGNEKLEADHKAAMDITTAAYQLEINVPDEPYVVQWPAFKEEIINFVKAEVNEQSLGACMALLYLLPFALYRA